MLLVAVLALAGGCGLSKEVELDAGDDGSRVELEAGQVLEIALESNPTTGYRWEVVALDENVLQTLEEEFEEDSALIGAGGTQTLRFRALSAGEMALELAYRRPWEEGVEPAETFGVDVVVN
jgi:inhibitor of cysteine peptidase